MKREPLSSYDMIYGYFDYLKMLLVHFFDILIQKNIWAGLSKEVLALNFGQGISKLQARKNCNKKN